MNRKQLIVIWGMGLTMIAVIVIFSSDYKYFWAGVDALWVILVAGGILIYASRDKKKATLESCVRWYMLQLKTVMFLRIVFDILLLSIPVFLVRFLIKDIKHSLKRIRGQVD